MRRDEIYPASPPGRRPGTLASQPGPAGQEIGFTALVAVMLSFGIVGLSQAGTMSVSGTAPVVDGQDIAMLNVAGQYDTGGNEGHIWNNRPVQGQTFTTPAAGVTLNAVTLFNRSNSVTNNTATWTVRVGTVVGTTFTPIDAEMLRNTVGEGVAEAFAKGQVRDEKALDFLAATAKVEEISDS